jgi:hypothetical protein
LIAEQDNHQHMLFSFLAAEDQDKGQKSKRDTTGLRINHQRGSAELTRLQEKEYSDVSIQFEEGEDGGDSTQR